MTPDHATALFPGLRAYARTATRLHPRPGRPGVTDSSVGGPLLWEVAGEPAYSSLHPASGPAGVVIGRGYSLWIFTCPVSSEHPHRTAMQ